MLTGHDERNFATLALIPTQDRLPPGTLHVSRTITTPSGKVVTVSIDAPPSTGMAHGLHNDLMVALIDEFINLGVDHNTPVTLSAHALLKAADLPTTGRYYRLLDQGLAALQGTVFTVTEGWFDARSKRYTTERFSLIDRVHFTHGAAGADRRSLLSVKLGDVVVSSVLAGHTKPLNLTLYHRLRTIGARSLLRLLDARLHDALAAGARSPVTLSVPLIGWAQNAGLLEERPTHLRRNLDRMHGPLLDSQYLESVTYSGRGQHTTLTYVFGAASSTARPEHTALLLRHGVQRPLAERAARELGERVLLVVQRFEERLRSGEKVHNPGAYLAKMLRQAEGVIEGEVERAQAQTRAHGARSERQAAARERAAALLAEADRAREQRLLDVTAREAPGLVLSAFQVTHLQRRGVKLEDLERLSSLLTDGRVDALSAHRAVMAVLMSGPGQAPHEQEEARAALQALLTR